MRTGYGSVLLLITGIVFFYNKISDDIFAREIYNHPYGSHLASVMNISENLKRTVNYLAGEIGPRGYLASGALKRTADHIKSEFSSYGYAVSTQPYEYKGRTYENIYVEKQGRRMPDDVIVVGAHYDTVAGSPGADDNASGIAGVLELARLLFDQELERSVQFVTFALEEPPLFRSRFMGSYVYAKNMRATGKNVEGMICLEMIGYFTDKPGSQLFPLPFFRWIYPSTGNFITLVSNLSSRGFLKRVEKGFEKGTDLPVETLSTIALVPGVDFSDHRSFWKFGYHAVMVTDTAFYRNPNYHEQGDVPSVLDYKRMADAVAGLRSAIEELAGKI